MSKKVIIEALIASPPTKYCQETVEILEEMIRRYPDELSLVVFKRGIDLFPEEASRAMKTLMQKGSRVPAVTINGGIFSTCKVPKLDELDIRIQKILNDSESN